MQLGKSLNVHDEKFSSPRKLGSLIAVAIVLSCAMTTLLEAQEIRPDEVGLATPIQNGGSALPATPDQSKGLMVNHLPPVDRSKYRDMKVQAQHNPDAQEADQELSFPGAGPAPFTAVVSTQFKGMDRL